MPQETTDYGEFVTDIHEPTDKYFWVWTSPGGQEYRGLAEHDSEKAALASGRDWLSKQTIHHA